MHVLLQVFSHSRIHVQTHVRMGLYEGDEYKLHFINFFNNRCQYEH